MSFYTYLPMKMEQTECSETSAYKIQTPGNYPEENTQHTDTWRKSEIKNFHVVYAVHYDTIIIIKRN
jgi:hypothetical protein